MQIPVRLYRQHDMDLLRVYMNKSIRLTVEMRNALIAYANNKPYSIYVVDSPPDYKGYLKPSIMIHVSIDDKKHPEVISLLEKLKKGQRCAFIKTLTRRYMTELPLSAYFKGDGIIMSKEVALMLEEKGYEVEGNNLLINQSTLQQSSSNLSENQSNHLHKDMVDTKPNNNLNITVGKSEKQIKPENNPPRNNLLNPLNISMDSETNNKPDNYADDVYASSDNILYVERSIDPDLPGEHNNNNLENTYEGDDSTGNDDSTNAFALFGKLAH